MVYFEWLFLPLLFFTSLWLILPTAGNMIWVLGSVLLGSALLLLLRAREDWPHVGKQYYFSKKDAPFDALLVLSPLALGFALADGFQVPLAAGPVLNSLLIYPFYALLQLGIFLAVPATRMLKLGYSSRSIYLICALVFSLVHFPNPILMIFTGVAMIILCSQFLRGRNILVLALMMGIAATGFRFTIPLEWGGEMRIGPDYMENTE